MKILVSIMSIVNQWQWHENYCVDEKFPDASESEVTDGQVIPTPTQLSGNFLVLLIIFNDYYR